MDTLANLPPIKWAMTHPRVAAWIVLSAGMIILLAIEARDVGLEAGNWVALILMTILVAGACIWIVSWEDVDESEPATLGGSDVIDQTVEMKTAAESASASGATATTVDTSPAEANSEPTGDTTGDTDKSDA